MGASDWPTWWVLLAPAMMLVFMAVCMVSMRCMTRGTLLRRDASRDDGPGATDRAASGTHVPARFPDGPFPLKEPGAAKDKAAFDKFMAEHRRPKSPS